MGRSDPRWTLTALRTARGALFTLAALLLGFWSWSALAPRITEATQGRAFERSRAAAIEVVLPPGNRPIAAVGLDPTDVAEGDLIGRIEIPRLEVSAIVLEGVSGPTLRRAVGHVPGTALPGGGANVALAAHRDSFFRPLGEVRAGDEVVVHTASGDHRYRVSSTRIVEPYQTEVLAAGETDRLTLITCYPFSYVGSAPQRFVVTAEPVS